MSFPRKFTLYYFWYNTIESDTGRTRCSPKASSSSPVTLFIIFPPMNNVEEPPPSKLIADSYPS